MNPTERAVFAIRGLSCASCALDVGRHIKRLPGVVDVNVNYVVDKGFVEFDPETTTWDVVAKSLTDRGYAVVRTR